MLNYKNLIILILLLLFLSYFGYKYRLIQNNNYSYSINKYENFSNNLYSNNLIEDLKNNINIISNNISFNVINNPGNSSDVLYINNKLNNNNNNNIIAELKVDKIQIKTKYKFSFIYSSKNSIINNNIIDIFKFIIKSNTINKYQLKLNKIDENENNTIYYNNLKWNKVSYIFEIPDLSLNENNLFINIINNKNIKDLYLTDLTLIKYLENSPKFILTKGLQLLIDINSVNPNNNILKDQSSNGFDFASTNGNKINYNINENKFSLYNNELSSKVNANKLLGNNNPLRELTISMYININQFGNFKNILNIPGNQKNSLSISIKNSKEKLGFIQVNLLDNETEQNSLLLNTGNRSLILGNTLITITFENNELSIYQEEIKITSKKFNNINLIPSFENPISINLENKNEMHPNLIGLAIFSKNIASKKNLEFLSEYFQNQRKIDKTSINNYVFNNPLDTQSHNINNSNYIKNNNDDNLAFVYDNDDSKINNDYLNNNFINSEDNNDFNYNNQNDKNLNKRSNYQNNLKNLCKKAINEECNNIDDDNNYDRCVRNLDINNQNCLQYCNLNNYKNKNLCKLDNNNCPYVYIKNNSYYVYIPKHCKYYKYLNKPDINYGKDRNKAMRLYQKNYPDCPIPDILKYPNGNHPLENCPFNVNEGNPCNNKDCWDVEWSKPIEDQNICKPCLKSISYYCERNNDVDDACICWNDDYKDLPECKSFRRNFEDPNDYQCSIDSFKIEEHPDFHKYIKRDNIPCWNCNLQTSNTNFKKIGNRYNR